MANAVNVNFRMDPDLKRNMEEVCAEMGLSMTTAFTIFAKKVSREHRSHSPSETQHPETKPG